MSDRYLWDRSGPPDPEVEKLERTLSSFAHDGRPLEMPELAPAVRPLAARPRGTVSPRGAAAAASLIVTRGSRPGAPYV
jgi:hypothetical protein